MKKLRKGDDVIVLSGKDKGKRGTIIKINDDDYVLVKGVNLTKKHQKPNPASGALGGIIDKEMCSICLILNTVINFSSKKPDRVGFKFTNDNEKIRIYKSSGEMIGTPS